MTESITVSLTVNGRPEQLSAPPHHTLVDMLRDELRLFGVREGCGVGMCGACTVLLDGKLVSGCLVLAPLAEGSDVVTVEGLESADGQLDPMQQSFVNHTAFQCAFCTPGFILSARSLLAEQPNAEESDVLDYLGGNLCRCGSYSKIMAAVVDARDRVAAPSASRSEGPSSGSTASRSEGPSSNATASHSDGPSFEPTDQSGWVTSQSDEGLAAQTAAEANRK